MCPSARMRRSRSIKIVCRAVWSSLAFGDATTVFLGSTYPKCTVQIVEARFVALQVNVDAFFHALGSRQKSGVFRSVFPTMWKKNRCCSVSASVRVLLRLAKLKQIRLSPSFFKIYQMYYPERGKLVILVLFERIYNPKVCFRISGRSVKRISAFKSINCL